MVMGGAPPIVTLNPADKNSSITLSNGNLTGTAASGWASVRATVSHNSGKYYYETFIVNQPGSGYFMFGLMSSADPLTTYPGGPGTTGYGCQSSNTGGARVYHSGSSSIPSNNPYAPIGQHVRLAVDFTAGKLWFGTSTTSTLWLGGGDPVSGNTPTGTFSPGTSFFPALGFFTAQSSTVCFLTGSFSFSPPGGYNPW